MDRGERARYHDQRCGDSGIWRWDCSAQGRLAFNHCDAGDASGFFGGRSAAHVSVVTCRTLRRCSHWTDLGVSSRKLESQDPFTRNILAINHRGPKFPSLRAPQSKVGKILARSRRVKLCLNLVASRINTDLHVDPQCSLNGVFRTLRHLRQDLFYDLTLKNTSCSCCRSLVSRGIPWRDVSGALPYVA